MQAVTLLNVRCHMVARVPSPIARRVVLWGPGSLCGLAALAAAMSFRAGRPSDADRHDPQAVVSEWTSSGGVGGAHFSPLTEISRDNVRLLRVAWAYRTGDVSGGTAGISATSFQATPIIVDGTLYFPTPFSRVVALDAETGSERWVFDPRVDRSVTRRAYVTSRGVATWLDGTRSGTVCRRRIFVATVDARLIALDGRTGAPCSDFGTRGQVDLRVGVRDLQADGLDYRQTAPPAVIDDLVIVGSCITDNQRVDAPSGVVRAFDARTGLLRWSWEPLADLADPVSGMVAVSRRAFRAGAANAWGTISVDTARGLVFVPTSSPSPDHFGGMRPGPNRNANSLVALDARTGRLVWGFQLVHHDLWDYDVPAQPALAHVMRGGERIPVAIAASKTGYLFLLHRATGQPFFPVHERPVPASDVPEERAWPTQPMPDRPRPLAPQGLRPEDAWGLTPLDREWCRRRIAALRSDGPFTPPSTRGTVVAPGFLGGMEWGGVAVDDARGLVITTSNNLPSIVTLVPRASADRMSAKARREIALGDQTDAPYAARRDLLLSPIGLPCSAPPWGTLVAVDMSSGDIRWQVPLGTLQDHSKVPPPNRWGSVLLGGPLATAGGVVFVGAGMDHRFRAVDTESGRTLWTAPLPASAQANPMTYRARTGGHQFVVVAAGGHAEAKDVIGDYVVAYRLP